MTNDNTSVSCSSARTVKTCNVSAEAKKKKEKAKARRKTIMSSERDESSVDAMAELVKVMESLSQTFVKIQKVDLYDDKTYARYVERYRKLVARLPPESQVSFEVQLSIHFNHRLRLMDVDQLREEARDNEERIAELKGRNAELKGRNAELEGRCKELHREVAPLKDAFTAQVECLSSIRDDANEELQASRKQRDVFQTEARLRSTDEEDRGVAVAPDNTQRSSPDNRNRHSSSGSKSSSSSSTSVRVKLLDMEVIVNKNSADDGSSAATLSAGDREVLEEQIRGLKERLWIVSEKEIASLVKLVKDLNNLVDKAYAGLQASHKRPRERKLDLDTAIPPGKRLRLTQGASSPGAPTSDGNSLKGGGALDEEGSETSNNEENCESSSSDQLNSESDGSLNDGRRI